MKRIALRGKMLPYMLVLLLGGLVVGPRGASAAMYDYCQVPPYVIQNTPPNVMLMVDISGSMHYFAYFDGFHTLTTGDDNLCEDSATPCTGLTGPGAYPTYKYYGYFNPDYWYVYSSNRFVPAALKTGTRPANSWDGNFLNWLTMRRTDILRKVLTGGKTTTGEGSGYDRLVAEIADCDARGRFKQVANAQDVSPYSGNTLFTVNPASSTKCNGFGSGTSSFSVGTGSKPDTYNVAVRVPIPVEGVLQRVVGAKARLGVTFYNVNEGGYVQVPVAGGSLSSTVNQINLTRANANTPMAETLWTIAGDFAQQGSILGGPGPMYKSGDFQTNNNNDPMNFGTGGNPRWPVCQKNFVLLLTDGEPCSDGNLPASLGGYAGTRSAFDCIGSGCPAVDNTTALAGDGLFAFPASTMPVCSAGGYTSGIEDVALYAHTTDLRNSPVIGANNIAGMQNLTMYTVFAFGQNSTLLKYAAINGGFEDIDGSNTPNQWDEWDANHDGQPDTYYEATDGARLEKAIEDAFQSILKRASSGTAASVLASGEGSGANLIQAVFYPRRRFGNDIISWTGSLQNVWYFVDPFFANASIREETTVDGKLNLANDYIAQFYFDTAAEVTKVRRYADTDGDGDPDQVRPTVGFEQLGNIWEAGDRLWIRNLSTNPRTIYTTTNGTSLIPFSVDNASLLPLTSLQASTAAEREQIIRFVHGEDIIQDLDANLVNDFRLRTVTFGIDNAVWKLGDIINSTPRIVGGIPLNRYKEIYQDTTYSAFTGTSAYRNRGMVFAGGNDGMLHAFKLGKLELAWSGQTATEKARLSNPDLSTPLGTEEWAFIPGNAQPYLKYLMDPDYCHLFYTDLSPYVFDASIGGNPTDTRAATSWRTVLIGGMRNGGACRDTSSTCTDCVKTPISNQGFSSYFALDVTDPENPSLLWEFSNPALGFASTGPSVIRIDALNPTSGNPDRYLNGKWYVVVGSGPTGPIDSTSYQFLGHSDQNLRFFILDLKTGNLVRTIDTGVPYAFAGSMINTVADFNLDYQDDAVYVGYVKKDTSAGTWTQGGVGRLVTKTNISPDFGDPSVWEFSKVLDDIGPVTSAVARLQNNTYHASWLFFGTGRYFFELPPEGTSSLPTVDDGTGQRKLFGVKDPCFTSGNILNPSCTTTVLSSDLTDVTSIASVPAEGVANSAGFSGWVIDLETAGNYTYDNTAARLYRAERVITDPLATTAGLVFFTTYKPYGDECALGGKSFLWATRYNTGGAPTQAMLKGKALVQVSTASVEQLDLSAAFQGDTTLHKGGRRTYAIEGVPPTAQGLSLLSPPPPVKRLMHIREK
jgi:type IV pilus assembly protein PilY1